MYRKDVALSEQGGLCALSKDSLGSRIRGNVRQRPIRDALDGTINQL